MVTPKLIAATLIGLVGFPAVAAARLSDDLKSELQGYVDTQKKADDPEAKQAALMTLGRIGGADAKKAIKAYADSKVQRVQLGAAMGQLLAEKADADDALVKQLADDPQLYVTLRDVVTVLPDKTETNLFEQLLAQTDAGRTRDVFRYLAEQHGDLYELLGAYLTGRDAKLRTAAVAAALVTARHKAGTFAQEMVGADKAPIRADGVDLATSLTQQPGGMGTAVDALIDALDDPSDKLADKAARRLVALGRQEGVAFMAKKLASAKKAKQKQAIAEYLLAHNAAVDATVTTPLTTSKNQQLESLGWQLAAESSGDEVIERLRKMFSSTVFDKRIIAIKALGRTGSSKAIDMLGQALFEGNSSLRLYAARGLGRIGAKGALGRLEKALGGERNPEVKLAVIDAISRIDSKKSLNLLRFQTTSRDPQIKLAVVKGIRRLGHPDGVEALKIVQQDRNLNIKWQAFLTAVELAPERGLQRMGAALRNPPDGFMADIEQLDAGTREKVIEYLLIHGNDTTRQAALSTARRLGDSFSDAYRNLVGNASAPDSVRRTALVALSERRASRDKSLFEKLARNSGSKTLQHLAAWTLVEYGSDDLEATFRGLLGSDDPAIKSVAAYGLATVNQ